MNAMRVSAVLMAAAMAAPATAEQVVMVGGQTNVALDMDLITSATGLVIESLSEGVIDPGNLPDSVAFGITSTVAASNPTSFSYDPNQFFESLSGSIEHRGSITFGGSTSVEVGNFTISYDPIAGFQVIDNVDLVGLVLFDIALNDTEIESATFDAWGDLKISNEFALTMIALDLTTVDLTGTDVGDAWIQGFNQPVPAPAVGSILAIAALATSKRRRR